MSWINGERDPQPTKKVVRGLDVQVLTSHVEKNVTFFKLFCILYVSE